MGFLGHRVALAWPGPVIGTTRTGHGGTSVALDLTDPSLNPSPLHHAEALFVAVAAGRQQDRRAVYVDGIERLLTHSGSANWRRVVLVSSTSALPNRDGWLDERCIDPPDEERGRVQWETEHIVRTWCREQNLSWIILRLGGLYGPGRDLGAVYRQRQDGPQSGHGHHPTNLIHVEDAVTASVAALAAPPSTTGVVHVVDDDHRTRRDMYAAIARIMRRSPPDWSEPVPVGAPPIGKRVSNQRLKSVLGVRLSHPMHVLPCTPVTDD